MTINERKANSGGGKVTRKGTSGMRNLRVYSPALNNQRRNKSQIRMEEPRSPLIHSTANGLSNW
jgi:hypothetical protein